MHIFAGAKVLDLCAGQAKCMDRAIFSTASRLKHPTTGLP